MSTPRCAFACPRCGDWVPADTQHFGPCAGCRSELDALACNRHQAKLARLADAETDGWRWDPAESVFRRGDEVRT